MRSGKVVLGLLAGLAAGALLGVLFAPDKGSFTRKKISRKGEDFADALTEKFNEFLDSISEKYDDVQEEVDKVKSKAAKVQKDVKTATGS
jgi:gas vesicle protein